MNLKKSCITNGLARKKTRIHSQPALAHADSFHIEYVQKYILSCLFEIWFYSTVVLLCGVWHFTTTLLYECCITAAAAAAAAVRSCEAVAV